MSNKTFYAHIKRGTETKLTGYATGFRNKAACSAFVSVKFTVGLAEYGFIVDPGEARDIAGALMAAADYSEPREATAEDLGIAA